MYDGTFFETALTDFEVLRDLLYGIQMFVPYILIVKLAHFYAKDLMKRLPNITTHFQDWYNEIIYDAELVDQSPVRGAVVIRPYGYAIWELIRDDLNARIIQTGHHNAAFPLLIPESFLKREAEHVEGFAPELAVVTYAGGKQLEEPLVIRPTSETMIHYMFARWIKSWRDLPLKINQWANVVRWEMRTRPFLRTTEFFWQEGHTAHITREEAQQEVLMMLDEYVDLARNVLAIPVVTGQKSATEKFPGAEKTYTFEGFMPDGKALQMGTSHLLSQSFAKAFDMKFQNQDNELAYPYLTSWGATTRLIGAVVMVHGDDKGLVLPPWVAPIQVVVIPILKKDADNKEVKNAAETITATLRAAGIRVELDMDESKTPGAKFYQWEMKGVPLRIEIGPRDLEQKIAMVVDRLGIEKAAVSLPSLVKDIPQRLAMLQKTMLERAEQKRDALWFKEAKLAQFGPMLQEKNGFYQTGWCGDASCEAQLKQYQATIRCVFDEHQFEQCFACDKPSVQDVLVAKAY